MKDLIVEGDNREEMVITSKVDRDGDVQLIVNNAHTYTDIYLDIEDAVAIIEHLSKTFDLDYE